MSATAVPDPRRARAGRRPVSGRQVGGRSSARPDTRPGGIRATGVSPQAGRGTRVRHAGYTVGRPVMPRGSLAAQEAEQTSAQASAQPAARPSLHAIPGAGESTVDSPRRSAGRASWSSYLQRGALGPAVRVLAPPVPQRKWMVGISLIVAALIITLGITMWFNAQMTQTAYDLRDKQIELNKVNDHISTIVTEVRQESTANSIITRAHELGMVPANAPGVVDLTTGTLTPGLPAGE